MRVFVGWLPDAGSWKPGLQKGNKKDDTLILFYPPDNGYTLDKKANIIQQFEEQFKVVHKYEIPIEEETLICDTIEKSLDQAEMVYFIGSAFQSYYANHKKGIGNSKTEVRQSMTFNKLNAQPQAKKNTARPKERNSDDDGQISFDSLLDAISVNVSEGNKQDKTDHAASDGIKDESNKEMNDEAEKSDSESIDASQDEQFLVGNKDAYGSKKRENDRRAQATRPGKRNTQGKSTPRATTNKDDEKEEDIAEGQKKAREIFNSSLEHTDYEDYFTDVENAKGKLCACTLTRIYRHICELCFPGRQKQGMITEPFPEELTTDVIILLIKCGICEAGEENKPETLERALTSFNDGWKSVHSVPLVLNMKAFRELYPEAKYYQKLTSVIYEEDKWDF